MDNGNYNEIRDYLQMVREYRSSGDLEGARQALGLARFLLDNVSEPLKARREHENVESAYTKTRLFLGQSLVKKNNSA